MRKTEQGKITKSLSNSFWLSILLHVLLILALLLTMFLQPKRVAQKDLHKKPPSFYVPAYTYKGGIKPSKILTKNSHAAQSQQRIHKGPFLPDKNVQNKGIAVGKKERGNESILASSLRMLQENQQEAVSAPQTSEPIYLIGDMSQAADPLIKLIGRALSANFRYPEMAGRFGIRGRTIIGLTLHPEGYFSDVQVLRSSQNRDLDDAALYAVNQAPTITGANRFISAPKHFVIGFIFN